MLTALYMPGLKFFRIFLCVFRVILRKELGLNIPVPVFFGRVDLCVWYVPVHTQVIEYDEINKTEHRQKQSENLF